MALAAGLLLVVGAIHATVHHHRSKQIPTTVPSTGNAVVEASRPESTLPILDNTLDIVKHNEHLYDWLTEQCLHFQGQPFRIKAFGLTETIMLSSPAHYEDVLKTQFDNFEKGPFMHEVLEDLLGNGIFAADGAAWLHQRKTASRLFTMRTLRDAVTSTVHKHLYRLLETLSTQTGSSFDLSKALHQFTLEAFTEVGFGLDIASSTSEQDAHPFQHAFDAALKHISLRFLLPRPAWKLMRAWNVGAEAQFKADVQIIHETVMNIIEQALVRRATEKGSSARQDLVTLFLDSFDDQETQNEDKDGQSKREKPAFDPFYLRDIVLNILIAGRDTTAQALCWFFFCLSEHRDVEQRILDEIRQHAPSLFEPGAVLPTMEQVQALTYLEAAIKETLRLYPSVPLNMRAAVRDTVLFDGTFVRAGSMVGLPTYALGRMPHVWGEDAAQFNPQRWFDPSTGDPRAISAFQFASFHAGPRTCLGQHLAMLEMKIVAVALLTRFKVQVVPGQKVTYGRSLTLPMKDPFLVQVLPRQDAS
ncbi:hypothetical protein ATCC90586_006614 [Pythium insidiosum]|nr:hypothetical protein ATCC90586_006614 [Pythium insidiosum]